MRVPVLRTLSWAAVAILIVFAVVAYAGLPDSVPAQVGPDGTVARYEAKSLFSWLLLPAIALATHLLIQGIGAMLPSRPHWFNFPDKDRFLALPRAYQGPVIVEMRTMLDITALGVSTLMLAIQFQLWRTALGQGTPGMMIAVAIAPVVLSPAILIWLTRINSALDREEARWRAAGSPVN